MKLLQLLGFCFLVGCAVAIDSSEENVTENGNSTDNDDANFVVNQNSEEALKVEPLEENIESRLGEEPAMAGIGEQGDAFQGDILLTDEQRQQMFDTSDFESRTGFLSPNRQWPKSGTIVTVPYIIDRSVGKRLFFKKNGPFKFREIFFPTAAKKTVIRQAMQGIEKVSCVRFRERKTQKDYVRIKSHARNCQADLGRTKGEQKVELGPNCFDVGVIMHELIHTLGYTHMQNHANRDQFVTIHWDRINEENKHNFEKVNVREYGNFNTAYDFQSIMHYGANFFAKQGISKPTIEAKPKYKQYQSTLGSRGKLTAGDIKRINNMYKCSK